MVSLQIKYVALLVIVLFCYITNEKIEKFFAKKSADAWEDELKEKPPPSTAEAHACMKAVEKSQEKEASAIFDLMFDKLDGDGIGYKRNGFYLEMGALNGIHLSNTYSFNKCLGWKGLLIEANPQTASQCKQNRPDDTVISGAVCNEIDGHLTFDFVANSGDSRGETSEEEHEGGVKVPCSPLSHTFKKNNIDKIDFWSLDVEGSELIVLQTVDFDAVDISIIMVECDDEMCDETRSTKGQAVDDLLTAAGYKVMARTGASFYSYLPRGSRKIGQRFHYLAGHRTNNVYVAKNMQDQFKCVHNSKLSLHCVP
jgi:FkbM family methyltransferase